VARGTSISGAGAPTSSARSPSPSRNGRIETGPLKAIVRKLPAGHPLRVVILSEPEEIDGDECFVKLTVWLKLLPAPED
jgi:hypothetical protein